MAAMPDGLLLMDRDSGVSEGVAIVLGMVLSRMGLVVIYRRYYKYYITRDTSPALFFQLD